VFRPQFVTYLDTNTKVPYTLNRLGTLIENPKKGHQAYYRHLPDVLSQHGDNPAEPGCWLVMRKQLLCRNLTYPQQVQYIKTVNERTQSSYEEELDAIDIATMVLARHVLTGERYLSDGTGEQAYKAYSRCKESIKFRECAFPLIIGNFASDNLHIDSCNLLDNYYCYGPVGLLKYSKGDKVKEEEGSQLP